MENETISLFVATLNSFRQNGYNTNILSGRAVIHTYSSVMC